MYSAPLVSINILSYNRKEELRNTLTKVFEQDYKNIEVIVVDNSSSDGSAEMIKKEYPTVILIKMEKNIGIAGWNEGFTIAKGEYVLVLDDDSYPQKHTIEAGINCLNNNEKIGAAAFNIYNPLLQKFETESWPEYPNYFIGCGALLKKKIIQKFGGFNPSYFVYNHELDFCIKLISEQYEIVFCREGIVVHNQSLQRLSASQTPLLNKNRYRFSFITYSIFLIQNFESPHLIYSLLRWVLNRTIIAFRFFYFAEYFKSLAEIFAMYKNWFSQRNKIRREVQKRFNYGKMPIIDKEFFPNSRLRGNV